MKKRYFIALCIFALLSILLAACANNGTVNRNNDEKTGIDEQTDALQPEENDGNEVDKNKEENKEIDTNLQMNKTEESTLLPRTETQIVADLQENQVFLDHTDVIITDYEIIKRRTDAQNFVDTVYIHVLAANDSIAWNRSYVMTYGLYNDGWILDKVEAYETSEWNVKPLRGLTDEEVDVFLNQYKLTSECESIELIDHITNLEGLVCSDEVSFAVSKNHAYSKEVLEYMQTWYFNDMIYDFAVSADPFNYDRTVFLNKNIVGLEWNGLPKYRNTGNIFADVFDIVVEDLTEEGLLLKVTKKDVWAAHWNHLDAPPEVSAEILCTELTYFNDNDEIGISLSGLGSNLNIIGDNDTFGSNDYLMLDLDYVNSAYIDRLYGNQVANSVVKNIASGKTIYEELADFVIPIAKSQNLDCFDVENQICGVWVCEADYFDLDESAWLILPNGEFEVYGKFANGGYKYGKIIEPGEIAVVLKGKWELNQNTLKLTIFDAHYEEEIEAGSGELMIRWLGTDIFSIDQVDSNNNTMHRWKYE